MLTHESEIKKRILLALSNGSDCVLFNNPVGVGFQGRIIRQNHNFKDGEGSQIEVIGFRRIAFGLFPGSSDLIGLRAVKITPDMIGQVIGQFVAVEVKTATGRERTDQKTFRDNIVRLGGLAVVARSVKEAVEEVTV